MSLADRIYIFKRKGFRDEAQSLKKDFSNIAKGLQDVSVYSIYDIFGIHEETLQKTKEKVFSEIAADDVFDREKVESGLFGKTYFAVEYLPGQFDQRADSAVQCILLLSGEQVTVKSGKLIVLEGATNKELERIKKYYINAIEMREKDLSKLSEEPSGTKSETLSLDGFIEYDSEELKKFAAEFNLAMNLSDLQCIQSYFKQQENRNPTETEIRLIDTYWSDHCRHTTFLTKIQSVHFVEGPLQKEMENTYRNYLRTREFVHGEKKEICLMDMATIVMKEMRKKGMLEALDQSEEINACTVNVKVDVNGQEQEWLLLFKNETHNHPTEIEPFGGAATCIGGAIRDPLSGRAYVYQGVRISGAANPLEKMEDTLQGKLPQRVIVKGAAHGFSSYGNQIGLATSLVREIYHEGYKAKHMELGAVVGAVPKKHVKRKAPEPGDIILLIGGRTGRDGIGGASGSSKAHNQSSLDEAGAEVQKGNAPEERKLQRLFRNPAVSKIIKKCNDFGAGGVAVAIGELARGVFVDLNRVPLKYTGLTCTEIAISESQERMAVVISSDDELKFLRFAEQENLEATVVGTVTAHERLTMIWNEQRVVDIARTFLDTNGAKSSADVVVAPLVDHISFSRNPPGETLQEKLLHNLRELSVCSQQGMVEMFDSTIGAGTVLLPYGGKYQKTENEGSVHLLPVSEGETKTASAISFGYSPELATQSPYLGGMYSVIEALAKLVSMGVSYQGYLTMQEYFKRLKTPQDWGQPFSALLGVVEAQKQFGIAAIGGKDSMSGSFESIHVPPTVVAFAVNTVSTDDVVSAEFKKEGSKVFLLQHTPNEDGFPNFDQIKANFDFLLQWMKDKKVLSAWSVKSGGIAEALCKMSFGNRIGFVWENETLADSLFDYSWGSIIVEAETIPNIPNMFGVELHVIGTTGGTNIQMPGAEISIDEAQEAWESTLERIYPTKSGSEPKPLEDIKYMTRHRQTHPLRTARPRVAIPVFPGTNCEYDTKYAFEKHGAVGRILPFTNRSHESILESIQALRYLIDQAEILMLSGGFSAGDEPDGSGKFISIVLQNQFVQESIEKLLERGGLVLGICNGFQALIKSGLLPYGKLGKVDEYSPTLATNRIGRHVSKMIRTKVVSNLSPWYCDIPVDTIHQIPVSHGEGRFVADPNVLEQLLTNGQIATRYVDWEGNPTMEEEFNPNGSAWAIEGITSRNGRILGKMGHPERYRDNIYKNIPQVAEEAIFRSGVNYFK